MQPVSTQSHDVIPDSGSLSLTAAQISALATITERTLLSLSDSGSWDQGDLDTLFRSTPSVVYLIDTGAIEIEHGLINIGTDQSDDIDISQESLYLAGAGDDQLNLNVNTPSGAYIDGGEGQDGLNIILDADNPITVDLDSRQVLSGEKQWTIDNLENATIAAGNSDILVTGDSAENEFTLTGTGQNTINAGAGDDTVRSLGSSDDTYVADTDSGNDIIIDAGGNDTLVFEGINTEDVLAVQEDGYLHLYVMEEGNNLLSDLSNSMRIQDTESAHVESFQFENQTLSRSDVDLLIQATAQFLGSEEGDESVYIPENQDAYQGLVSAQFLPS